jgi:hypothetical protein
MKTITNQFEFKYQGESHSIDINTLLTSQFHYAAILNEIKNNLYPDIELKIRIQSFEEGSFDINQLIEITTISGLFVFQNVDYISQIFRVLKAYIDIKKVLEGKKPEKIEELAENKIALVINGNNNTVIVDKDAFNIYQNNYQIHKALYKNAEILEHDPEIDGVKITNKTTNETILDIPRSEFLDLSLDNPFLDKEINVKIIEDAVLYIRKLEISPKRNSKWDFIYEGRKINSVPIHDDIFLNQVIEGKKFGNGDRLKARLRIIQKLDIPTGVYLDEKYEVLVVKNIVPKNEQTEIFK